MVASSAIQHGAGGRIADTRPRTARGRLETSTAEVRLGAIVSGIPPILACVIFPKNSPSRTCRGRIDALLQTAHF